MGTNMKGSGKQVKSTDKGSIGGIHPHMKETCMKDIGNTL